ncbi:MAG: hypothetical protein SYR96_21330 [Actinomycetota bacterium]|nr:hypothetical protein [Actinomycetota bacterium]
MVDFRPRRYLVPLAALSLLLAVVAVPVAASAAIVGTATRIVGAQSGRCLDVPGSSTTKCR